MNYPVPAESEQPRDGHTGPQRLRWDDLVPDRARRAVYALLSESGRTDFRTRRAIVDYAMSPNDVDLGAAVPGDSRSYVDNIIHSAHSTTDEDVDQLRAAGMTEDRIYEVTLCAAVGASLGQFEAGLRALNNADPVT